MGLASLHLSSANCTESLLVFFLFIFVCVCLECRLPNRQRYLLFFYRAVSIVSSNTFFLTALSFASLHLSPLNCTEILLAFFFMCFGFVSDFFCLLPRACCFFLSNFFTSCFPFSCTFSVSTHSYMLPVSVLTLIINIKDYVFFFLYLVSNVIFFFKFS